ncbi:hypothetical protein ABT324_24370 [Saccharopolyspora sp. NPDC000359]|uniref:hypothetical protein n=1 Tax=Saccharopolyspora sp. NPDC000359 TaxID=3154251 RepID=UPI00331F53A9
MRRPQWMTWARARALVLAAVVVWAAWLTWSLADQSRTAKQETGRADSTQQRLDQLAADIAEACRQSPDAAARIGAACVSAEQVQREPRVPTNGQDGADGRGITATSIRAGRLVVSYSDGTTADVGPVAGQPGATGAQGRGIVASVVDDGALALIYSDGTREAVGRIVGRPGDDGADGRGIAEVTADGGRLVVTYTDGTREDAGPLPPGPQGEPGAQGDRGEPGPDCPAGYELRPVLYLAAGGGTAPGMGCVATDASTTPPTETPDTPETSEKPR